MPRTPLIPIFNALIVRSLTAVISTALSVVISEYHEDWLLQPE
jgi:cell division protein FtsL